MVEITEFSYRFFYHLQLDSDKLVALVAAGDTIIGSHHMVKWPIAKVVVLFCPDDLRNDSKSNSTNNSSNKLKKSNGLVWDVGDSKNKTEILLRYHQTPAVISSKTLLVYSQPRTPGMCSVLNFWP